MARVSVGVPPASLRPSAWTDYAAGSPVSSALLLFGLVLVLQWLKNGRQLPDRRRVAGLLLGAGVVVLSARVAPDFVTMLLVALLVVGALDNADTIVAALRDLESRLLGPTGGSAPRGGPGRGGYIPIGV
jgi:hypothetical protein